MLLSTKDILTTSICAVILFVVIYVFALSGNIGVVNFFIPPLLLLFMIYRRELIITLYLIVLPTAGIIPSDENILEAFGLDEFINLFILGFFIYKRFPKYIKSKEQNIAISLLVMMILIILYTNFKNSFFDIYDGDFFIACKRIAFTLLKYYPLVLIITHIRRYNIRKHVYLGIYLSGIVITISQFYNEYFSSLGLVTFSDSEFDGLAANISQVNRFAGFYDGDPNSAGAYLLMLIGFMFIKIEKSQQIRLLYCLFLVFLGGILMTASRTVFIAFGIILILFLFNNRSGKTSFQILISLTISLLIMSDFLLNQMSRFHNAHYQIDTDLEGNRIMKWVHYIQFMTESPIYFLTGSQMEIDNRSAHNVYVQTLFNAGVIPLTIFISKIYKSFLILVKRSNKSLYFIIPFFCITFFVGELKEFPLFALLIVLFFIERNDQTSY